MRLDLPGKTVAITGAGWRPRALQHHQLADGSEAPLATGALPPWTR